MPTRKEDSISRLCSILADERCRHVIGHFRSASNEVATLDELVDSAVAGANAATDRKREAIWYHHITLPKLAHADVLKYEPKRHKITYSGHDDLESLMDRIRPLRSEVY